MTLRECSVFSADETRIEDIETSWRRRLNDSLRYLGDHFAGAGHDYQSDLKVVCDRVASGPVSPWVSCLYSKLVAEATRPDSQEIGSLFRDLRHAATDHTADYQIVLLDDERVPQSWWDHFKQLMDTDRARAFEARPPPADEAGRCRAELNDALTLLSRAAPDWAREMEPLLRMVVLGSPTGRADTLQFDAVSSFFLRGVVLANAGNRKSPVAMIDMLVHETSHILLFGLTVDEALTTDRGTQRYASPVRKDPRPIEGIFHACFVATRIHLAMSEMLAAGRLTTNESAEALDRQARNGRAALQALETIHKHASPTSFGADMLRSLNEFWAKAA